MRSQLVGQHSRPYTGSSRNSDTTYGIPLLSLNYRGVIPFTTSVCGDVNLLLQGNFDTSSLMDGQGIQLTDSLKSGYKSNV